MKMYNDMEMRDVLRKLKRSNDHQAKWIWIAAITGAMLVIAGIVTYVTFMSHCDCEDDFDDYYDDYDDEDEDDELSDSDFDDSVQVQS